MNGLARRLPRGSEAAALLAILVLAAVLRLPGLDQRGGWEADQGRDMLVLDGMVSRGEVPLLGPPTSIGGFHHGVVFYYLIAPAAVLSGGDPIAVTGEFALAGIAAVAVTWWLARLIGGPPAALAAAVLAAVSPSGIEGSTYIWNPNLVPLAAALAFAGTLRATRSGSARWWLVAAAGAMLTTQLHIVGVIILPPLVITWLLDVRSRRRAGEPIRTHMLAGAGAVAIIAAGFIPLALHELAYSFTELRSVADYLAGGGAASAGSGGSSLPVRLAIVLVRALEWPLAGLVSDHEPMPMVAAAVATCMIGLAGVGAWRESRRAAAGLAAVIGWSIVALAVLVPSLAVVTPGLPNDQYHGFLDPLVLALAGAGTARLATLVPRWAGAGGLTALIGRLTAPAAAVAVVMMLVVIGVSAWPPAVASDGGWRLADETAARIVATARSAPGTEVVELVELPSYELPGAIAYPLLRRGLAPGSVTPGAGRRDLIVVACDPLFDVASGAACGGVAEARWASAISPVPLLLDRFAAGSRRVISLYDRAGAP